MGINGKNSEFHAVIGLLVLPHISEILSNRKEQTECYKKLLKGLEIAYPNREHIEDYNYSYFQIIFQSKAILEACVEILESNGIGSRRYFMPSLNTRDYTSGDYPISEEISKKILCLPLYDKLKHEEQRMSASLLLLGQNNPAS
jgi:dTDP-4-amino-4,6-dideoxygalactose transaminase